MRAGYSRVTHAVVSPGIGSTAAGGIVRTARICRQARLPYSVLPLRAKLPDDQNCWRTHGLPNSVTIPAVSRLPKLQKNFRETPRESSLCRFLPLPFPRLFSSPSFIYFPSHFLLFDPWLFLTWFAQKSKWHPLFALVLPPCGHLSQSPCRPPP